MNTALRLHIPIAHLDRRTDSEWDITDVWFDEAGGEEKCVARFEHFKEYDDAGLILVPELIGLVLDDTDGRTREFAIACMTQEAVDRIEDAHRSQINDA